MPLRFADYVTPVPHRSERKVSAAPPHTHLTVVQVSPALLPLGEGCLSDVTIYD